MLAVGRIAAQNLLATDTPIARLRGQVHRFGTRATPLIVTYHPAYLLRSPSEKRKAWGDLKFVRAELARLRLAAAGAVRPGGLDGLAARSVISPSMAVVRQEAIGMPELDIRSMQEADIARCCASSVPPMRFPGPKGSSATVCASTTPAGSPKSAWWRSARRS